MPLPTLNLTDAEKRMVATRVRFLERRMPYRVVITTDPAIDEDALDTVPLYANDLESTLAIIDSRPADERREYRCSFSRRRTSMRQGGRMPYDEPYDQWDIIVPGSVHDAVRGGDVCYIVEDREAGEAHLYTIKSIAEDRLRYMSYLSVEEYGHRQRGADGAG